MAINLASLNLPSLRRDEVMDMRSKSKFPPEMTGNHREAVTAYDYIPAEKGKGQKGKDISACFQAKVKILDSDNALAVGREYTLRFWLGGDHQKYSDRDRFAFIAACMGESPDNPEFDEKAAEQKLVDTSETNGFAPEEDGTFPCQIFHTRTSKTKERAAIKDGKPIIEQYLVAQDYFAPVA
jgi:hypothetical protein